MSGSTRLLQILEKLCGFQTVSDQSNLELIAYCDGLLSEAGFKTRILPDKTGLKANLHAVLGDVNRPGIIFAGHTDVVPVTGQSWGTDPFRLTQNEGLLIGRGVVDMKGYVATALSVATSLRDRLPEFPIHVLLTYDEEIGCFGARDVQDYLKTSLPPGCMCLLGEPTEMIPILAHKGIRGFQSTINGSHGHAAYAAHASNAIHYSSDLIQYLLVQDQHYSRTPSTAGYETPRSTIQVGKIEGGVARNMIAETCRMEFEFRHLPEDSADEFSGNLEQFISGTLVPALKVNQPDGRVETKVLSNVPAFLTQSEGPFLDALQGVLGHNQHGAWDGVTEAGYYAECGIETIVCGPGSLSQAHQPDESLATDDLYLCEAQLHKLIDKLPL